MREITSFLDRNKIRPFLDLARQNAKLLHKLNFDSGLTHLREIVDFARPHQFP